MNIGALSGKIKHSDLVYTRIGRFWECQFYYWIGSKKSFKIDMTYSAKSKSDLDKKVNKFLQLK